jgi:prephenate dehydrogenase
VAASSPAMWRDIFLENRVALLPLIEILASRLDEIKQAVARDDEARLEQLLDAARETRARLLPE